MIETGGETLRLTLDADAVTAQEFDGSFELVGEGEFEGSSQPFEATIGGTVTHMHQVLELWTEAYGDSVSIALVNDGDALLLTAYDAAQDGVASGTVTSLMDPEVTGTVAIEGDLSEARSAFAIEGVSTDRDFAAALWTYLASVTAGLIQDNPVANDGPTYTECRNDAEALCTRDCNAGGMSDEQVCIKSFSYDPSTRVCAFTCQSVEECCGS